MGRTKKLVNISEAMARIDNWRNGRGCRFSSGTVVERGESEIGVVTFPHVDVESYMVKWYRGPNPWDFVESVTYGWELRKSDKPNPLKYKNSDRYPGPSSKEIDRLNEIFSISDKKVKTAKEVEEHIAILEEEIYRTTENNKKDEIEEDIDSVVDETLDDAPVEEFVDSVDIKRKKIIDDEA